MRHLSTPGGWIRSLQFAPDGRSVYCLTDDPVQQFGHYHRAFRVDLAGRVLRTWAFTSADTATFTADLRAIYCADSGDFMCHLRRYDLATGRESELLHTDEMFVRHLAVSPNQHLLAADSLQGLDEKYHCVRRFDVLDGVLHGVVPGAIRTWALCLAYSPDGRWLATGCPGISEGSLDSPPGVRIWEGMQLVEEFPQPAGELAWSPDGQLAWGIGQSLLVGRPGAWVPARPMIGAPGGLAALSFSPDSQLLLSGSQVGVCSLHDVVTGSVVASFEWGIGPIHSVAFSPDGLTCAAGGEKGQVVVWDVDT